MKRKISGWVVVIIVMLIIIWAVMDIIKSRREYAAIVEVETQYIMESNPGISKDDINSIIDTVNERSILYNRDPFFYLVLIKIESGFNVHAIGARGEIGLMQILPGTAMALSSYLVKMKYMKEMLNDPIFNIQMGIDYFEKIISECSNNLSQAIRIYNAGPINIDNGKKHEIKIMREYAKVKNLIAGLTNIGILAAE